MPEDCRRQTRAERRRRKGNRQEPATGGVRATMDIGRCRFPAQFSRHGCCICGHASASQCPCDALDALVHLERAHPNEDSAPMREMMGCPISGSAAAPLAAGGEHTGQFQAPCDDMVVYITTARFPTLAHYRWHALYDHLQQGACNMPNACGNAVTNGAV